MGHTVSRAAGALAILLATGAGAATAPPAGPPRVLLLNSYAMGHTWTEREVAGFVSAFRLVHPEFEPYVEFMDCKRHPEPENLQRLRELYRFKYAGEPLDAVVTTDNAALDFALAHRAELFPEVPIIFCGLNGYHPGMLAGHERVTGVAELLDVEGTLELMLRLHPRTRQILVATEASEIGAMISREIDRDAASLARPVEVRHARATSRAELLAQIEGLPDDSLVLIDAMSRDATGQVFRSEHSARAISEHSRFPVYGFWEFQLGQGILGGWLIGGRQQGELAAGLTLQVLGGEQPAPIAEPPGHLMLDYAQLKRFGIEASAVPDGAVVINAPPRASFSWRWMAGALLVAGLLAAFNLVLLNNIRQRRRAEQSLRERERRFRALVEHGSDLITTLRPDYSVDFFSPSFATILGYRPAELARLQGLLIHPQDLAGFEASLAEAGRAPRTTARGQTRLRHRDGGWRRVEYVLHNLLDDPAVGRFVLNAWDVTERIEAEKERSRLFALEQEARQQAEATNRSKDEFLAMLSHELRTPLTPILGWVHVLRAGPNRPETRLKALEVIERNARAQGRLIEDLLDLSRIVSGRLRLEPKEADLASIASGVVDSLKTAADAKQIVVEPRFELDAAPLFADPDRLQQIVWNLLSNAIKFTPPQGRIEVRLREHGGRLELAIQDSGEGLAPENLPRLFTRFWQADSSSTRRFGGLGLGLSLVRHLVELHGGEVRAESPGTGQGSTFSVLLPRTPEPRPGPPGQGARAAEERPRLDGLRVLVVEDEPDTCELLVRLFEDQGATVARAAHASQALEVLERFDPELLLSDLGLPGGDGYSLLRAVRERGTNAPAIALTAYTAEEHQELALAAGFQLHLAKPIEPAELLRAVARMTGRESKQLPGGPA